VDDALELNRALWDERALLHGQDDYYDIQGFLKGDSSLSSREIDEVRAAVGDVAGLDLLHLQCHFGLDSLSWARMGAHVTGLDFSPVAVARARDLAVTAGLEARFIEGDAQALPELLRGAFDVVFASYGILCWIGDVRAWMRSAASALRPGGHLVLIDFHPLFVAIERIEPLTFDFPYLGAEPIREDVVGSYAQPDAKTSVTASVEFAHGLGEITTAAADAGLRVEMLTEWLDDLRDARGVLDADPDGRFRLRVNGQLLPVLYGLRARREPG
jgi:SAM-dependent methyltransferase